MTSIMASSGAEKVADIQASATVDWSPLGDIYVKKYVNYHLDWQVDLSENLVAVAPYGGPVALLPKNAGKRGSSKSSITIYTLAGRELTTIPWEGGHVVALGWTGSENLVCVLEEGTIVVYSIYGQQIYSRIIAREVREHRVKQCKFFHTVEGNAGFAVMTYNFQFFVVGDSDRSRDELRVKKLADLPATTAEPKCWAVLPQGNQFNVLAAVEDKLYILDPFEAIQQNVMCRKESPLYWVEVAVSLNGRAVALVDKDGYLWGGSSDFKICETEFDLQSSSKVLQMQWGGKDFFVLVMDRLMFVKGFRKHWCKYPLRTACVLMAEIDGVRILTNHVCEFIHRVTSHSMAVLRIGSMEVGALLNDAYKEFEGDESHKADEYIRFIKERLPEAVTQCVKAAGEEFTPRIQQSLLKSASFGRGFLGPDVTPEVVNQFLETSQQLRVLNNVRNEQIGIPITMRQYYRLSTGVLIDRLINRGLYPHALEICKYLCIPPAKGEVKVRRQWALRKVRDKSVSDDQVAEMIIQKLKDTSAVVSFAEIARAAWEDGRNRLAAQLLDFEVHARDQVPLLMEMKKADLALDKAMESGDPQLVYRVLDDLKYKHYHSQMDRYLQLFHNRPVAAALYKKLCKETDQDQLLNLYRQESDFLEAGCVYFTRSFSKRDPEESKRCFHDAMKEFRDGQHLFALKVHFAMKYGVYAVTLNENMMAQTYILSIWTVATEEQVKLMQDQSDIESKHGVKVKGLSLFHTVLECVKGRQPKIAEQLRKEFKLSDSQFWWAKIRGLTHIGDYEELEKFSKQKRSPIGYEPFAEVCMQHGNYKEASKYIPKVAPENRFQLYMAIDDFYKAADIAFQVRSLPKLEEVQAKASRHPELMEYVKNLKAKLGSRI